MKLASSPISSGLTPSSERTRELTVIEPGSLSVQARDVIWYVFSKQSEPALCSLFAKSRRRSASLPGSTSSRERKLLQVFDFQFGEGAALPGLDGAKDQVISRLLSTANSPSRHKKPGVLGNTTKKLLLAYRRWRSRAEST